MKVYSILYIENSSQCSIIDYISNTISSTEDTDMKLASLHNTMLSKLFKALKKNPKNPEEEFEKNNTFSAKDEDQTSKNTIEEQRKTSEIHETDQKWLDFCKEHMPPYVKCAFYIDQETISVYGDYTAKSINEVRILIAINEVNSKKIQNIVGEVQNTIHNTGENFYFFYPVQNRQLIIETDKGSLGIYKKEIEKISAHLEKSF